MLDGATTLADVQAAARNVARGCLVGGAWQPGAVWTLHFYVHPEDDDDTYAGGDGEGDTPVALLRALRPLLAVPSLDNLVMTNLQWDAELVGALGEALPRTCTTLSLQGGSVTPVACMQLARSAPWLQELDLGGISVRAEAVITYFTSSRGPRSELRRLIVHNIVRAGHVSAARWARAWQDLRDLVQASGAGVELLIDGVDGV